MARIVVCLAVGFAIHLANTADIVWTTLGTHGGGPISGRVTSGLWKLVLLFHRRLPNHRVLSFVGSAMVVVQLTWWIALVWLGWFAIFSAQRDSVVDAHTHQPPTAIGRLYFTAYAISTMGNGDFVPNGRAWQIATSLMTIGGMGALTLTITFLMNVLPAVVQQRTLAAYISDLGATPARILERGWSGEDFDTLHDHFLALTGMIHLFTEQHLAYPVLHFFHGESERTASSLRLAALSEVVILLNHGVAAEVRMPPMVILPLRDAMRGMREVMTVEFVHPVDDPPPPPDLALLRSFGIPTVDDETFARSMAETRESRRFFAGLVRDDGWPWERLSEK